MTLVLAMSTAVLAKPIFEDRGAEASNKLSPVECCFDYNSDLDNLDEFKMSQGKFSPRLTTGSFIQAENGNDRVVRKKPGRTKYGDITLERGNRCGIGGDCDDRENDVKPGKCDAECPGPNTVELTRQTWNFSDTDSDGDGILALVSSEVISTNQGQVISAIKSEKKTPKFKAGAELSKSVNSMNVGDFDGDGFADIAVGAVVVDNQLQVTGTEVSKRSARTGAIKTETPMKKAELIEAMASEAGLSKADSKKALDIVGEIILGEDRDMVMPGKMN